MLNEDQNELLVQFRSGDQAAFEKVFMLYFKALRLNAYLLLKDEQEAEDMVQQLFLDIWNQQLYRTIQHSLKAYLHTAIKHRCLNNLKKASRQTKNLRDYAFSLQTVTGETEQDPSPQLLAVLGGLPPQQSRAFNLIHLENRRYQEAAFEMGISINSLKSHLKLAVKFLRLKIKSSAVHPSNK